jgi:hypothetical protein
MNKHFVIVGIALSVVGLVACGSDGADESGPTAEFAAPADGATVAGGVAVEMVAHGVTIEEAGEATAGAGHFHVIADAGCVDVGDAITKDGDHVHFGKAQTSGTIYLEPGSHDLCLQVGDGVHEALDITDTVTLQVGIASQEEWCAVVGEVDELFAASDEEEEFATQQGIVENARRLLTQLSASTEFVDDSARADVDETVAMALGFSAAIAQAADEAAAEAALAPLYESSPEGEEEASAWILDTCGVDIDG